MSRKVVCDNDCGVEVPVDKYGRFEEEDTTPSWFEVTRDRVTREPASEENPNDEIDEIIINEGLNLEFCSVACLLDYMPRFETV